MKHVTSLVIVLLFSFSMTAQEDNGFSRNGKWIVETGSNIFTGLSSSTGGNIFFDEGITITQFGIDIGKFVSEDFAIKFRGGILSIEGESIVNVSGAAKYYLGGIAPIEIGGGFLINDGNSEFVADAHIGYAITLANNIYLEPKGGILYSNSDIAGSIKFSFVMIF